MNIFLSFLNKELVCLLVFFFKTLITQKIFRPCLVGRKFSVFSIQTFENKENTFSYENQTKTKFENKENEFTIFNILYMN